MPDTGGDSNGNSSRKAEFRARIFFYLWLAATLMYAGGVIFMLYLILTE